jgi:hypothetical protein
MSLGRVVSIAVPVRKRNEIFVAIVEKISIPTTEFCHEMSKVSSVNVYSSL